MELNFVRSKQVKILFTLLVRFYETTRPIVSRSKNFSRRGFER